MLTAAVKWTDGLQFVGESGTGHAIVMDAGIEVGGKNTGMRPMEMLLAGVAGCSGMDVASILQKKRLQVTGIDAEVRGEMAEEYPKKFTKIVIDYTVTGRDLSEEAVKKAIDLSMTKYCSVKATLEGAAEIHYTYKVVNI
ncbi:MAG TPA: OsmC family protein [Dissulfurispiraceae bacterium]|jgi:putative redox protein|nr:OsmC family protein [Dissulfurispiraceae bacterium]